MRLHDDGEWRLQAACRGVDVERFFPQTDEAERRALALCARCEVRDRCLDQAMTGREAFGVWGGTTEAERRRIFRRERRRRAA